MLVWIARRQIAVSIAASVLLSGLAMLLGGGFATPQLRGPSHIFPVGAVHAIALAVCIAFPLGMGDLELEERTPRRLRVYRGLFVALLIVFNGALLVAAHHVRGGSLESIGSDLRTGAIVAGVMSCVAWWASFYAAMAVLLAYFGCLLFAGVGPAGTVEWWARPLVHGASTIDALLAVVGLVAVLAAWLGTTKGGMRGHGDRALQR